MKGDVNDRESKKFCVYMHKKADDNVAFYVGMGSIKRAHASYSRNGFWKNVVKKHGFVVEVLEDGLTQAEACGFEITTIAEYGRRVMGTGNLVNITGGGDGFILMPKRTKEHTEKIACQLRGRRMPEAQRQKFIEWRKTLPNRKVIDVFHEIIYDKVKDAAIANGIGRTALCRQLNGTRKHLLPMMYLDEWEKNINNNVE